MPQELEKKVEPVQVHLICDCGKEMDYTNMSFASIPPKHIHHCAHCGAEELTPLCYPHIRHKVPGDDFHMNLTVELQEEEE